jgi:hypothetical protein
MNEPTIEDQIAELKAAGWIAKTNVIWKAPDGRLYIGPHGAWKHMRWDREESANGHATSENKLPVPPTGS